MSCHSSLRTSVPSFLFMKTIREITAGKKTHKAYFLHGMLHIRNFQTQKFYHPNELICTRIRDCKHFRIPNPSLKKTIIPKNISRHGSQALCIDSFRRRQEYPGSFIALISFTNVFWAAQISKHPQSHGTLSRPRAWSAHGRFVRTTFWWLPKISLQRNNFYHDVCVVCAFFNWVKAWNHQRIDSQAFTNGWPSASRIIYIYI